MTQTVIRRGLCRVFAGGRCLTCGPDATLIIDALDLSGDPLEIQLARAGYTVEPLPSRTPDLGSPIETLFWHAYLSLRPPALEGLVAQHPLTINGHHYRIDFALPSVKIGFELDGYLWPSSRAAWAKDRRRDLAMSLLGWSIHRFDGSLVYNDAASVVRIAAQIVGAG